MEYFLPLQKIYQNQKNQDTTAVCVDDTLASGNAKFERLTDQIRKAFEPKKKEYTPFVFVVININNATNGYFHEDE